MSDVNIVKHALEDTKFNDPQVRELLVDAINALHLDLRDCGYIMSVETANVFDALESYLNKDTEKKPTITVPDFKISEPEERRNFNIPEQQKSIQDLIDSSLEGLDDNLRSS